MSAAALERVIAAMAGPDASAATDQLTAVDALVDHRRRVLVVQATGWGKSAVYWAATAAAARRRRRADAGRVAAAGPDARPDRRGRAGRAARRDGELDQRRRLGRGARRPARAAALDVLLISPERLANPGFAAPAAGPASRRAGCWSSTRRTASRTGASTSAPTTSASPVRCSPLAPGTPVLATTATANAAGHRRRRRPARRRHRHAARLAGPGLAAAGGGAGLSAAGAVRLGRRRAARAAGLGHRLRADRRRDRAGRRRSYRTRALTWRPTRARPTDREELEDRLRGNEIKALVATSALGMGYDKPDLAFCIHLGSPASPVAYYQQVGRAGRALDDALAVLVPAEADERIWEYFATSGIPDERAGRAHPRRAHATDRAAVAGRSGGGHRHPPRPAGERCSRSSLSTRRSSARAGGWVATGRRGTSTQPKWAALRAGPRGRGRPDAARTPTARAA